MDDSIEKTVALDFSHRELLHTQPCFDLTLVYAFQLFELLNAVCALDQSYFVDFQAMYDSLLYIFQVLNHAFFVPHHLHLVYEIKNLYLTD